MELPDLPDDAELRGKIERITSSSPTHRMPDVPDIPGPARKTVHRGSQSYDYGTLGVGMSAAYAVVGSMAVGFGLGWLIDRVTHSEFGTPIGAVLGAVLGVVSALFLINRSGGGKK